MRVVLLSDTHGMHNHISVPKSDVVIHCGDFTGAGSSKEADMFVEWLGSLDATYKLYISGNHDRPGIEKDAPENGVFCLNNKLKIIQDKKFYGFPYTPVFRHWYWMANPKEMAELVKDIPEGLNVLISHGPPKNILDLSASSYNNLGSPELLARVEEIVPRYHVFGHIHERGGRTYENGKTQFINCSVLDERYNIKRGVKKLTI